MESLFPNLGGVLRLAAITFEALLRFAAAMLFGFGMFLCVSFGSGRGELLSSVWSLDRRCEGNHAPLG